MVESVDTKDLKSFGQRCLCGFKSHPRYLPRIEKTLFPQEFIEDTIASLGSQQATDLLASLQQPPIVSVRLNEKQGIVPTFPVTTKPIPWNNEGLYLSERIPFTLDPLWHAGCYYVQEASSMILQQVLEQCVPTDSVILDLCAAPGGKTTLISQWLKEKGLLVSNEVIRQRLFALTENVQKWGNGNVVVTHNKPMDFGERAKGFFDCILIDVPCSGEGMFRKDVTAVEEWNKNNVLMCVERQKTIIRDVWDSLKPGGILLYSTCTFNPHENEENIVWIIQHFGAQVLPFQYDPSWGLTEGKVGYHCYPHKMRGEGLYFCILRKPDTPISKPWRANSKSPKSTINKTVLQEIKTWVCHPEQWFFLGNEKFIRMYPLVWQKEVEFLLSTFTCLIVGVDVAELHRDKVQTQHPLSMCKDCNTLVWKNVELSLEQALAYLHLDSNFISTTELPVGEVLLTYKHVPMGFCNNIGTRFNNLYPREWRIRNL